MLNGATKSDYYIQATNSTDLVNAFSTIFQTIATQNQVGAVSTYATTAPSVGTSFSNEDLAVTTTLDTGSWSSELQICGIQSGTVSSICQTPSYSNRQLLLSDGHTAHLYQYSGLNSIFGSKEYFKINNNSYANEWRERLLAWYDRYGQIDKALKQNGFVLNYRNRSSNRNMGDIIDNPILGVADYMITSANDGMVYVFKSQKGTHPYDLKFNLCQRRWIGKVIQAMIQWLIIILICCLIIMDRLIILIVICSMGMVVCQRQKDSRQRQ